MLRQICPTHGVVAEYTEADLVRYPNRGIICQFCGEELEEEED